ncbi:hypothetical protein [Kribbella amoyensis]|nr:hypothetical protein [Kribbella amoyensis]
MGEELGFIVADLDRGALNAESLTTAIEDWETYGRSYLAQNAIRADTVFPPQPAPAAYDPADDVAVARSWINADLRRAEKSGDRHRAAVLRDFDAQLNSTAEQYKLRAAEHRGHGREETPELDREVFLRELGEHAANFSGKVHPGTAMQLPYDILPMLTSSHPGLWERHEQVFGASMDWASKVRHPILDTTVYQPRAGAAPQVRDHAVAVQAWAMAAAERAGTDGKVERRDALNDFADDVSSLLDEYETRAAAQPSQVESDDLAALDLATFRTALDHVADLGNEILPDDDQIVLPDQLRAHTDMSAEHEAHLSTRQDELFKGLRIADQADEVNRTSALIDHFDDVDSWISLAPPDLGHQAILNGLSQQADQAVAAGDLPRAAQYREMIYRIHDEFAADEWRAVAQALHADDRQVAIAESRAQVEARLAAQLNRRGLQLPTETDGHNDESDRFDDRVVENTVRHAYAMIVTERADERATDWEAPSDDAPVPIAQLHARITAHTATSGQPPYAPERIDAALQRLTATTTGARAELLDHDHRGEQSATVRITDDATVEDVEEDSDTDGVRLAEPAADVGAGERSSTKQVADENIREQRTETAARQLGEQATATEDVHAAAVPSDAYEADNTKNLYRAKPCDKPGEQRHSARQRAEAAGRTDTHGQEVKAAIETSACSVAISRAQRSVDQVHERIEADQDQRRERDDELARWHADDRAADAGKDHAIDDTGPGLSDDLRY